ncbi:MAG: tyrosine-type recombinase/integrase [Phycisphaeraceae bacterium]|nr:tyrosine-type recombinase/integrase [Phycisphaeraceae bacterium]
MLAENPFAEVRTGSQTNRSRMHFITREVAAKVLDACPDAEWRAIFAHSRYGGLRRPSEHLALRWRDVDWAAGRLTVWSSKTEAHEGGAFRVVPLFPELRAVLMEAFEVAESGGEHVVARYRQRNCNLRTQLLRILSRAGVPAWPRLFHNLRSSRQTELTEEFPAHVVSAWLGNSVVVAQAHYLQVRDRHFDAAVGEKAASNVAQNPAQSGAELARSGSKATCGAVAQGAPVQRDTAPCKTVPFGKVTPMGFEPMFSP